MTAEEVKELRRRSGLSLRRFAEILCVRVTTVYNWEHGINSPSRLALQQLAQARVALERAGR